MGNKKSKSKNTNTEVGRKGRVIRSTGSWYDVQFEDYSLTKCRLRGKFKNKGIKLTNPIAVGDWVEVIPEEKGEDTGLIINIEPRSNYIIRRSSRKIHFAHIIASNLDQAVLIATLKSPRTSTGFIDRFLVTCEAYDIPAVIVFNKMDLLAEKDHTKLQPIIDLYKEIGYNVLTTSIHDETSMTQFDELLKGKVSLVTGHSGVGKSSIIKEIAPDLDLRTNEISRFSDKGTHTTTFAEMHPLDEDGTYIVDTPGIKEFGLIDMEKSELAACFPEMRSKLGECKFHNCIHVHEPGCAAKDEIDEERYYSYLLLLEECE